MYHTGDPVDLSSVSVFLLTESFRFTYIAANGRHCCSLGVNHTQMWCKPLFIHSSLDGHWQHPVSWVLLTGQEGIVSFTHGFLWMCMQRGTFLDYSGLFETSEAPLLFSTVAELVYTPWVVWQDAPFFLSSPVNSLLCPLSFSFSPLTMLRYTPSFCFPFIYVITDKNLSFFQSIPLLILVLFLELMKDVNLLLNGTLASFRKFYLCRQLCYFFVYLEPNL